MYLEVSSHWKDKNTETQPGLSNLLIMGLKTDKATLASSL
jgi:hypothetical protein